MTDPCTSNATIRSRIHLGRTIKEGWHYESTVELTTPAETPASERRLHLLEALHEARRIGEEERDFRNQRDRQAANNDE